MADIKFTSKLDGSGFKRGMAGIAATAQSGAQRAGREFAKSFNQQINRFLGIGFAIAMFTRFTAVLKDAQRIRLSAILQGLSPERLQAIEKLTEALGDAFSKQNIDKQIEIADAYIATGDALIYTREQTEKMAEASSKLQSVLNDVKGAALTVGGFLADMFKKTQGFIEDMALLNMLMIENRGDAQKSLDQFASRNNIQRAEGETASGSSFLEQTARELAGTQGSTDSRTSTPRPVANFSRNSDQLQRIGLFVGGAGNPVVAVGREQLAVLNAIRQLQRQTLAEVKRL
jgi:hypothetical protein